MFDYTKLFFGNVWITKIIPRLLPGGWLYSIQRLFQVGNNRFGAAQSD